MELRNGVSWMVSSGGSSFLWLAGGVVGLVSDIFGGSEGKSRGDMPDERRQVGGVERRVRREGIDIDDELGEFSSAEDRVKWFFESINLNNYDYIYPA